MDHSFPERHRPDTVAPDPRRASRRCRSPAPHHLFTIIVTFDVEAWFGAHPGFAPDEASFKAACDSGRGNRP
ncbi:hypothetical protein OG705_00725 [Streptomyces sp. NBC_00838]|uniref:hypothetical protein n=1 Tax=Streptomyces sp. NBC_00838 TaxID=2903680 RepID=UPI00386C618F|nr:hypothetical protein OG705_00725 [Streptomyces sp. NBC_00838]